MSNDNSLPKEFQDAQRAVFDDLAGSIGEGKCIPFIGAGVSMNAGFPGWWMFLKQTLDMHAERIDNSEQIEQLLKVNKLEEVAELLDVSLKRLGVTHGLSEDIRRVFGKADIDTSHELFDLIKTSNSRLFSKTIVTTNYDSVIETVRGISQDRVVLPCVGEYEAAYEALKGDSPLLVKIHGTASDMKSHVLTKQSYADEYLTDNGDCDVGKTIPRIMNEVSAVRSFLFIGCSLKGDRYLDLLRFNRYRAPHVALLRVDNNNKVNGEPIVTVMVRLRTWGIEPLFYFGEHDQLVFKLRELLAAASLVQGTVKSQVLRDENTEDTLALAKSAYERMEYYCAIKICENVLRLANLPECIRATHELLGKCYYRTQQLDAAEKSLNLAKTGTSKPSNPIEYMLSRVYLAKGDLKQANAAVDSAEIALMNSSKAWKGTKRRFLASLAKEKRNLKMLMMLDTK